jgi:hypothetical protein
MIYFLPQKRSFKDQLYSSAGKIEIIFKCCKKALITSQQ